MEPEETQDTATGPYPERNESSPCLVAQVLHVSQYPPTHDWGINIAFKVEFGGSNDKILGSAFSFN
jgi:hypothetical protein